MIVSFEEALEQLKAFDVEFKPHADPVGAFAHVGELLGRTPPPALLEFYRAGIVRIEDFRAFVPRWNAYRGWRPEDDFMASLLCADAVPLFSDGCGSVYGLDVTPGLEEPAVYFFDHATSPPAPDWAAGSSLARFLPLLAQADRALDERWPARWELAIDPDLERCPRAPAIWDAG
ncbi:SMI1/KNR4 family protein [Phenylobacterium sp.]|uniref:SMI1/KNR4 family protein n=1 Tax=Phenylobacterium sp. TaxID=1871053 RepID=UPI0035C8299B